MWLVILGLASTVIGIDSPAFSLSLNLTGWSPQVQSSYPKQPDPQTGAVSFSYDMSVHDQSGVFWVIGTHFVPYGTVQNRAETSGSPGNMTLQSRGTSTTPLLEPYSEVGILARFGQFHLGSYLVQLHYAQYRTATINYATLDVPVVTKA